MTEHRSFTSRITRHLGWGFLITAALLTTACAKPEPGRPPGFLSGSIPIDSTDSRYAAYTEGLRERIKKLWPYPCVRVAEGCEYRSADLDVEFGVLESGTLQFVTVLRSSGLTVYDDSAVNAVRLAAPYPPVPGAIMALLTPGSRGLVISARFTYTVGALGSGSKP